MAFHYDSTLHSYYITQTANIYRRIGDERFADDLDALARALVLGLWHCHKLTDDHVSAINAVYSKGRARPTYLYWELVSAASAEEAVAVPDFFRVLALLDRSLDTAVCREIISFLRALLLRLCDDAGLPAEIEYISAAVAALNAVLAAESPLDCAATVAPARNETSSALKSRDKAPARQPAGGQTQRPEEKTSPAEAASEAEPAEPEESVDELLAELDSLIGMDQIKQDVRSLINLIKVRRLRRENGLATPELSLHMVFTGNPGTGKTTVARLLARLYRAIGVLEKGTLVEVDRSGLVAGYVGQTALKTQEAIEKAVGGILFIDEAYALAPEKGSGGDFGQEAIETVLKAMEDKREELVVIAAGYPEPMERFISSNPGLQSRFGKYFHFEDYTGGELFEIFKMQCARAEYEPDAEALEKAEAMFNDMYAARDENFGNARDVRNIFEKAVARQSDRVAQMPSPTRDDLLTLTAADLFGA
jgi:SpoVK/Ycf46/Vps4 family AAA+-type ATPase